MMSSWQKVKLADCVELLAGFPFKSHRFSDNPSDVPLVKGENVSQGRILWDISKRWPVSGWDDLEKFHLVPGDVVVAMDRPWIPAGLKWSYIREGDPKALLVQRCARLRSSNGCLDQDFLRFVIGGPEFEGYVKPITTGVNVPHISGKQILDFEFTLPPLPIQRRIAGILSAYDDLIENSQRRIKILEEMARRLYREWFVHFRFPGHEDCRLVDSPLGGIPEGWEVQPFSALASYVNGYPFKPAQLGKEGKPIIKIKELKAGIVVDTPRNPGREIPGKYHVCDGDVLFSWSADLDVYLWRGGEGLLNQHLFNVVPAEGISRAFCFHALKESMPRFRALSLGATMHHIKRSALDLVFTVVSPVSIRNQFQELVCPMHLQLVTLTRHVRNLRRTRDLLLPRLLSGQIDVEALQEVAAVEP
jgi:type I restriction enzyme S subunit